VIVLSRDPERVRGLPAGVRAARWDGRTAAGWEPLLAAGSAVLNLAGEGIAAGRWNAERKRRIRDSRVDAGQAVVEAVRLAAAAGRAPAVVLQASGVGYYGDSGDREIGEDHPSGADFLGEVSVAWEASSAAVEALGVRRAVLRTGVVLDPAGGALAKLLPPFRLGIGGPLGGGGQWFPWIHRDDEVGAILFLLATPAASGPFNLCAPQPVTSRDFARALGRQLHRPSLLPVPAPLLRLAVGELADAALLRSQRALPRRLLAAGYRFRFPDLARALADLVS
ncbi:MAG TPA: TIGR01777 family oxidoreductase, partial [Thermoanaerobaculia bacterium]|nr:TIGR01777 family oxidoreductase [Thermoanaerobaculia bacterium]